MVVTSPAVKGTKTRGWTNKQWLAHAKKAIRDRYEIVDFVANSRSYHTRCHTAKFDLREIGEEEVTRVIGKRHVPSTKVSTVLEGASRSPAKLHADEVRNLSCIDDIVKPHVEKLPFSNSLIGDNTAFRLKILESLSYNSLLDILKSTDEDKKRINILQQGVYVAARFDGYCTRFSKELLKMSPDFKDDHEKRKGQNIELLGQRLKNLSLNPNFDPNKYVHDLRQLRQTHSLRTIFADGDLNLGQIRADIKGPYEIENFICINDLEDFGLYSHVTDVRDVLMIRSIGTSTITSHKEFSSLLERYLALMDVFETGGDDSEAQRIAKLQNGEMTNFLKKDIGLEPNYFADFILEFYAGAVEKLLQFALDHNEESSKYYQEIEELYHNIAGRDFESLFAKASKPKKMREKFYIIGSMLCESEVMQIDSDYLQTIHRGSSTPLSDRVAAYDDSIDED